MLGGNLPENRPLELKLFSNEEVLAVNQQGQNPRQLYKQDSVMIWVSDLPDNKGYYVALFNLSQKVMDIPLLFSSVGMKEKISVRDLWKKNDMGVFRKQYTQQMNPHGSVLLRISSN